MLIKQKSPSLPRNFGLWTFGSLDFWPIANSVIKKGKFAIPPLFNGLEVMSSASDKAKLFAENFTKNSLPVFSSRTNLKLFSLLELIWNRFSYYTLMTFLMMLSVILLSMLMILLSILSVIRHLICGNNLNWLLNLNLIYETLWTGVRSGLLISMLGKLSWFRLTGLITLVLLMWKWMGLFLRKNHLLRLLWGWFSVLNWIRTLILSLLLKLPQRKLRPWFVLWHFFLLKLLCISINLPYTKEGILLSPLGWSP